MFPASSRRMAALAVFFCGASLFAAQLPVFQMRGGIPNTMRRITQEHRATVGFLGGSITEMRGYVDFTEENLPKRFPECRFKFVRAGLSSTCSDTGAFRLKRDILNRTRKLDLLFVEFAVNDNQDGHFEPEHSVRGIEGIVRQVRAKNPEAEIVLLYSANESHLAHLEKGEIPREIAAHESVAEHYGLPSIAFVRQVSDDIHSGHYDWKGFGGVHPARLGNRIYADLIDRFFASAAPGGEVLVYGDVPPLDASSFSNGRIINVHQAKFDENWNFSIPNWEKIPGKKRDNYTSKKILHGDTPGATLTLDFTGTAIGYFTTAGQDAGIVEYSVDGVPFRRFDNFTGHSLSLHYPYTVMLEEKLAPGKHTLTLKISGDANEESTGHAIRIFGFTAS